MSKWVGEWERSFLQFICSWKVYKSHRYGRRKVLPWFIANCICPAWEIVFPIRSRLLYTLLGAPSVSAGSIQHLQAVPRWLRRRDGWTDGRKKRNRIDLKGDLRGIIYGMHREWFLSHWLNYSSQSLSSHLTLDRNWLWEGAAALTNLFNIAQVAMNSIGPVSIQNYHNQSTSNRSISQNGRHSFRLSQYDKGASFRSMDRR